MSRGPNAPGGGPTCDMVIRQTTRLAMNRTVPCDGILDRLIERGVIHPEEWAELTVAEQRAVAARQTLEDLLTDLEQRHLLTRYQADRVRAGRLDDLVLSQYRLLEPIGRGGMGVVYRGEHIHLRRPVAVKVLMSVTEMSPQLLQRFFAEARAIARLRHPHIVGCLDAGWAESHGPNDPVKYFYVMEYIAGQDLQSFVHDHGPMPAPTACGVIRDCAEAMAEAHRIGLIHRDLKPSNVMIGADGHPWVLDFGLAKMPNNRMTEPGTLLGTIGYMAPEQATDSASVDHRADIFSLGATLFWALTGEDPFPSTGNLLTDVARRTRGSAPSVRAVRPDLSPDLDRVIGKMLATDPAERYQSMALVSLALRPFTRRRDADPHRSHHSVRVSDRPTVLIVDDDPGCRSLLKALTDPIARTLEAGSEDEAEAALDAEPVDLVITDFQLESGTTAGLVNRIRAREAYPPVGILLVSGAVSYDILSGMLAGGADDYLLKPFDFEDFRARVRALLRRREAAKPAAAPAVSVVTRPEPEELPAELANVAGALQEGFGAAVALMLEEAELHGRGFHLRVPEYVKLLAEALPPGPARDAVRAAGALEQLTFAALTADVGTVALPREIVLKLGLVTEDEKMVLQTHTTFGHQILTAVARTQPALAPTLTAAAEVALTHHEWFDGTGFPNQTPGEEIPFAARLVGLVLTYEAMRTRKPLRPALSHPAAVQRITELGGRQFDPQLVDAFVRCAPAFARVGQQHPS